MLTFGDHPERSMYHLRFVQADGDCLVLPGERWMCQDDRHVQRKSTATSSIGIGWPYFSLTPPPPRIPVPIPLCPV